eukprot:351883-Chlamydomonas_euryale.AAC.4
MSVRTRYLVSGPRHARSIARTTERRRDCTGGTCAWPKEQAGALEGCHAAEGRRKSAVTGDSCNMALCQLCARPLAPACSTSYHSEDHSEDHIRARKSTRDHTRLSTSFSPTKVARYHRRRCERPACTWMLEACF